MVGTAVECEWYLGAGADRGDGRGSRAEAVPARAVTALGASDDPGTAGTAQASRAPTGEGRCRAGEPGDSFAPVATRRDGHSTRGAGAAGSRRRPGRRRRHRAPAPSHTTSVP